MDSLPVRNARAVKRTKQFEYVELHEHISRMLSLTPDLSASDGKLVAIEFSVFEPDEPNRFWIWRFQPAYDGSNNFILMLGYSPSRLDDDDDDDWMLVRNPPRYKPSAARHLSIFGLSSLAQYPNNLMADDVFYLKADKSVFNNFWEQIVKYAKKEEK